MNDTNIIWKRPDGSVVVTWVADQKKPVVRHQKELQASGAIPVDWVPVALNYVDLPDTSIDTWEWDGSKVRISLHKLQEITKARLRSERASKLNELDVQFMRALEQGQDTHEIVRQKQVLRDITDKVNGITDIQILKTITIYDLL